MLGPGASCARAYPSANSPRREPPVRLDELPVQDFGHDRQTPAEADDAEPEADGKDLSHGDGVHDVFSLRVRSTTRGEQYDQHEEHVQLEHADPDESRDGDEQSGWGLELEGFAALTTRDAMMPTAPCREAVQAELDVATVLSEPGVRSGQKQYRHEAGDDDSQDGNEGATMQARMAPTKAARFETFVPGTIRATVIPSRKRFSRASPSLWTTASWMTHWPRPRRP